MSTTSAKREDSGCKQTSRPETGDIAAYPYPHPFHSISSFPYQDPRSTTITPMKPITQRQQTLDGLVTRSPNASTAGSASKRRKMNDTTSIDVDTYRDHEGQISARGKKKINRYLLGTLEREDNPITNSDSYDRQVLFPIGVSRIGYLILTHYPERVGRTSHVVTCATDVRQSIARSGAKFYISEKEYFASRHRKLGDQFGAKGESAREGVVEDGTQASFERVSSEIRRVFGTSMSTAIVILMDDSSLFV